MSYKNQNQEIGNNNGRVFTDIVLFIISPLALLIRGRGKDYAGNSKYWSLVTKGILSESSTLAASLLTDFILFICMFEVLIHGRYKFFICLYTLWNISLIPLLRIYLIRIMNEQTELNLRGGIEPTKSKDIFNARIKFGIDHAEEQYRNLYLENRNPSGFIGARVIPSRIAIPYFGEPAISGPELVKVIDEKRAIFPLDRNSPDHHLIIGQSGSGKTTLIKRMISASIKSGWRVILIDLKGDPDDAISFLELVDDQSKVRHFPSNSFNFWNGTKSEIAERVISFFPAETEPYYLSRNSGAIHAVITRCELPAPQSVQELIERLRNGVKFSSNPEDVKFFSMKERGLLIGDLIANDVSMNLDAIRNIENQTPFRFGWGDNWDLSVFTLDGFKPSSLKLADALLNDFASWMFSEERAMKKTPILLVIDEASAFSRMPQVPILTALIQRARSAQVSLVYASQNASAFGADMKNIIHSGAIRWLGVSTEVEDMIGAAGTTTVIESGFQFDANEYTGVISHRNQKEFKIDPDRVKELPTFHWFVSSRGKVSSVFVPPLDL